MNQNDGQTGDLDHEDLGQEDPVPEASSPRTLIVGQEDEGLRLDTFISDRCPEYSRTRVHEDIAAGNVTVGGRHRAKSFRMRPGDQVLFSPQPKPALKAVPQDIPLNIVHQDEHILVLNKAVGMVVHPAPGHPDGTLVNALLHHLGKAPAGGGPLRPGIVHRLDRDTSGLMVVALTELAHTRLSAQLQDRRMGRTYHALSWGQWGQDKDTLTGDVGRHPRHRQMMAVVSRNGRPAITHYEVLQDFGFVQFCRIHLETGRTHQIRVHFAHNHHPVVGDMVYGDDRRTRGMHGVDRPRADAMLKSAGRQMLHASTLRLVHPADGQERQFDCPLPFDMATALDGLVTSHPA